jgi:hypothetical protein
LLLRGCWRAQGRWFFYGILSYLIGMAAKGLLYLAGAATGLDALSPATHAAVAGVLSALAELGAAAPFLWRRGGLRWPDVIAFGAAIGLFEMVAAVPLGWLQMVDETGAAPSGSAFTTALGWGFLLERGLTLIGHVSSRALLYAAWGRRSWWAGLLVFLTFALTDGVATLCDLKGWADSEWHMQAFYAFAAALTAVEIGAVLFLVRRQREFSPADNSSRIK